MMEEVTREDLSPTIRILANGKSKIFVITNTPKKRRLDPIDSSTRSHQDEGNSRFIDPTDPAFDYLLD
jgi:hypothetical protein